MGALPGDIYEVKVTLDCPKIGQIQNVMHYAADGTPSAPNPYEVALDLITQWGTGPLGIDLHNCLASDIMVSSVSARRIYPIGGPTAVGLDGNAGSGGPPCNDTAVACNIQLITDDPPFHEGHIFLAGLPGGSFVSNVLTGPIIGTITTFFTDLLLPIVATIPGTTNYKLGVWNKKTHTLEEIVAGQIAPKPTSLSKRLKPFLQ